MKEKLYTIELNDAVGAGDECMFCVLERKLEQETLEFVLGCSYMESDIREQTDRQGFCRTHTKMMYEYGNSLGNAWILKSRLEYLNQQLKTQAKQFAPEKGGGLVGRMFKGRGAANGGSWILKEESHCYICDRMKGIYDRMLDTFVHQLRQDPEFCKKLLASKGFCIHHYGDVLRICQEKLTPEEQASWIPQLNELMSRSLDRVQEDINWLIEKYDYRNKDADWRESKDAVPRTMQKIVGGYPADPPFQGKK